VRVNPIAVEVTMPKVMFNWITASAWVP
ncbi:hypothetical protein A2U01_0072135, partial [Trifolium medium]|nr:hypothetical protein [Trifolium medium]